MNIDQFISNLAAEPSSATVTNPWHHDDPAAKIRCGNLHRYFSQLRELECHVLLVGEAPGYQGCRRSGIPFTSEPVMLRGVPSLGLLGADHGYTRAEPILPIRQEPSATIVWQTLESLQLVAALWAAFPLHPHKVDQPLTNRAPRKLEISAGQPYIEQVIELLAITQVVAVGNVAATSLATLGIDAPKVRHPAQGGKNDFVGGLAAIFGSSS